MPRGKTRQRRRQQGGMKFSRKVLQHFIDHGIEYNELNVIAYLISNANDVQVVWDASRYSFVFELTFPHILIDPYGLPLAASAATLDKFTAAAAAPEPGTHVSNFCVKISFVHAGASLSKEYHATRKSTVVSEKANKEAATQRRLFEAFACRRTTAPFVPDVIAHAILSGDQFRAIFENALSSTAASSTPGVHGTPKEIYDWIDKWITSNQIEVDAIVMEMMDLQRTAPGAPGSQQFKMIYTLRSRVHQHRQAALRMMADIAAVRGKGIMPHDFHEGNGLATEDGLQLYLIDWGGLFDLTMPEDRAKVLDIFKQMCANSYKTSAEASAHSRTKAAAIYDHRQRRLTRFPSLEDLCEFFQIGFDPSKRSDKIISELTKKFQEDLDGFVDFTCVAPTPQNVHKALMMVAFVDFMANNVVLNHPYCQCGNVLRVVYPDQDGSVTTTAGIDVTAFDDFRLFLRRFKVGSLPSNSRLPEVVAMITENVRLCPSACAPLPLSDLRPDSWINDAIREAAPARLEAARLEAERLEAARLEAARLEAARLEAERLEAARLEAARLEAARRMRAQKAEAARLKAERLEANRRMRAEAARLKAERLEAARLEAEMIEAARRAEKAARVEAAKTKRLEASRKRLESAARKPGVSKLKSDTKKSDASVQVVAVPTSSWLSRANPLSWFKKGGTHKRAHGHRPHRQTKKKR